jgi:hypothetical protein
MSKFRSSLDTINNNVLKFARHNDAHSNDALRILLENVYTLAPAAIIVETGVNYRSATTDFQAWAIYYNPENIFNPAAPNVLELVSQFQQVNNFAYTGTFEIFNEIDLDAFPTGDYFCLTSVDYQAPAVFDVINSGITSLADVLNDISINNFNNTGAADITILWESTGVIKTTTFSPLPGNASQYMAEANGLPINLTLMLPKVGGTITGDAIPPHTTTGRFGILLNQYNTNF